MGHHLYYYFSWIHQLVLAYMINPCILLIILTLNQFSF